MVTDTSTAVLLLLLLVIGAGISAGASDIAVSDDKRTGPDTEQRGAEPSADETVSVVITLQNHTARETVSFAGNVTVTGGSDVEFMPVLFAKTTTTAVAEIRSNPKVAAVRIDRQVQGPTPTTGVDAGGDGVRTAATGQTVPWGVRKIGADRVSDRLRKSAAENVTVAVVDSGIDYTHPDLDGTVEWGANFLGTEPQYGREAATDDNGHGTAVAGIIAAEDNDHGVVGVTPGAQLYSIKVLDESNTGTVSSLIEGINAALEGPDGTIGTEDDADVIQVSVGTEVDSDQLAAATAAASESAVVVSSVGNDGDGDPATAEVTFPAGYEGVLGVAATDRSDETKSYSAEGSTVDVAAPGDRVTTLSPESGTTAFSGTSAAAPHVSGTIVALLATDSENERTSGELHDRVSRTADDIEESGVDRFSGSGLVRMDTAVAETLPTAIERTSSKTLVTGGEAVTITQTAYATERTLTVEDSFTPSVGAAEIQTVTVNGEPVTPSTDSATATGTAVSLRDLDIGDRVRITYSVELPVTDSTGKKYHISGVDHSGDTEEITIQLGSQTSAPIDLRTYDLNNDGEIDAQELGIAGEAFTRGEISASELGALGEAFTRGTIRSERIPTDG